MKKNFFAALPDASANEVFEPLLRANGVLLERIVSLGQATPEGQWYDQETDEWVMLVAGSAGLRIESEPELLELRPGDYVFLPAHQRHRVEWTSGTEPTLWLALHLSPT